MATAGTIHHDDAGAIALPTGRLIGALIGACAVGAGVWLLVATVARMGPSVAAAGPWAAVLVGACAVAGLLAIGPWKTRPVSLWISLWLGQTVVRLLLTPVVAWLLYSATSPVSPMPLALAVGFTYLAAVLSEAAVLARFLKRSGPA